MQNCPGNWLQPNLWPCSLLLGMLPAGPTSHSGRLMQDLRTQTWEIFTGELSIVLEMGFQATLMAAEGRQGN